MPRQLDTALAAALAAGEIQPFFMALLSFKTSQECVWTGVGNIVWNGQTFTGVGSFAKIGTIQEGDNVQAYGTTVTLSGIDPVLLGDCMTEMVPGAQATLWLGCLSGGVILGTPYQLFSGTMDQPTVSVGVDTISITLALETKMLDLQRASNRRYTQADQRLYYPTDTGFAGVEVLNDQADIWGAS
jgi:hypothetical protein